MQGEVKFSSKRFLLTLTLCACSVILLQNHDLAESSGFTNQAVSMALGLFVCALLFIPAIIIKKQTDSDLSALINGRSKVVLAVVYALYFVYLAEYFLFQYTDMFTKKYFPAASPCLIAFAMCAVCVYAAYKGVNVITRFGIFLFILAMVTNLLMFGGGISSVNFSHQGFGWSGNGGDFLQNLNYFITPAFIVSIFVFLSGCTRNFKLRQPMLALFFTGLKYALVLFFVSFAAGSYAYRQEYQTFVLSRVAHFGSFAGIESFYMALATMSVFLILSLLLCCQCRGFSKEHSLPVISFFSAAIFLLHMLMVYNNSIKEIFVNPYILNALTVITSFLIPLAVIIKERAKNA